MNIEQQKARAQEEIALSIQDGTLSPEKIDEIIDQFHQQTVADVVRIIKDQVEEINGEGSVFDDFANDIINQITNPKTDVWPTTK